MRQSRQARPDPVPLPRRVRRYLAAATAALLAAAALASGAPASASEASFLVRGPDAGAAAAAVHDAGGSVEARIDLIGAVAARLSPTAAARLTAAGYAVTPDVAAHLTGAAFDGDEDVSFTALNPGPRWDPTAGEGVTIALVDTGVASTPALEGRLVRGPDFSDEGDGIDRYGHGTFMAGLIAAADGPHHGVAPAARVVSVKVAGRDGDTTLSRVLEGIAWVVDHAEEHEIRVLNLSFAADIPGAWRADPLSAAVEAAWASGIVVAAAAGNGGTDKLPSPGRDPWVLTVGASDPAGTADPADDTVPSWSGRGHTGPVTKPELVAPGVDVVSLRVPGSTLDTDFPAARIGQDHFRGSGTSMSTALTSGAAAVALWAHPEATPDDVKGALVAAARPSIDSLDLGAALEMPAAPEWWQAHPVATGDEDDGSEVGPADRMPWAGARWSGARWSGARWSGARWSGARWSGARWSGARWSGARWSGARWSGARWSGARWSGARWSAAVWSGVDPNSP